MKSILCLLLAFSSLVFCSPALCETLSLDEMLAAEEAVMIAEAGESAAQENAAREDFIDRIIALAQQLYNNADGKAKRAQYSGDIYVCKNFTVHPFLSFTATGRPIVHPRAARISGCR